MCFNRFKPETHGRCSHCGAEGGPGTDAVMPSCFLGPQGWPDEQKAASFHYLSFSYHRLGWSGIGGSYCCMQNLLHATLCSWLLISEFSRTWMRVVCD